LQCRAEKGMLAIVKRNRQVEARKKEKELTDLAREM
jgi:hypothetical protein